MNLDLWDIDESVLFKKQFASSDPHDPIHLDEYLEDVPFVDDNEAPAEVDPFDWFPQYQQQQGSGSGVIIDAKQIFQNLNKSKPCQNKYEHWIII